MRRNLLHAVLWLLLVPWLASSVWFWLDGLLRSRDFNVGMILGVIPFAMAYGVIGMIICLVGTFPLYLLSAIVFNRFPLAQANASFRRGFIVLAALVGLGLSAYGNKLLNTGRIEFLLLCIGLTAGITVALATLRLWRVSDVANDRAYN